MDGYGDFERFESKLDFLDEDIMCTALEYASQIFAQKSITREEALEQGMSRAEFEKRNREL